MTRLPASCPLSAPGDNEIDRPDGPNLLEAGVCPLTGLPVTETRTVTGARGGQPVVHVRHECPQPCMTQWWVDSGDGALSWAGSELIVDHPDVPDDEGVPVVEREGKTVLDPSHRHGGGELDLIAWINNRDDKPTPPPAG